MDEEVQIIPNKFLPEFILDFIWEFFQVLRCFFFTLPPGLSLMFFIAYLHY